MSIKRCENFSKILLGTDNKKRLIGFARCKQWTCAYCAQKNKSIWRAAIIHALNQRTDITWTFLTITAHENAKNTRNSLKNIQTGWTRLYNKMKYHCRKHHMDVHYIRVYEPHKDGRIHAHMLLGYSPQIPYRLDEFEFLYERWFKDNARSSGMGYEANLQLLQENNAGYVSAYISKYMTKMEKALPKGTRRIQSSQNLITTMNDNEPSPYIWSAMDSVTLEDFVQWLKFDCEVIDLSTGDIITADDFNDNGEFKYEAKPDTQ